MSKQLVSREKPAKASPAPKMAFGSSVNTLLEIYSNCISLLKAFRRPDEGRHDDPQQAQLRKSLKSDRARVRRAYSTAVSEAGSRFEKGDDRSRSALSRVLKKLKGAITNILRSSGKSQQPRLDYESLMLLSNASRAETLRTFDRLSYRLGSTPSRTSSSKRRSGHSSSSSTSASKSSSSSSKNGRPDKKLSEPRKDERGGKSGHASHGASKERKSRSSAGPQASSSTTPRPSSSTKTRPSSRDTVPEMHSRTPSGQSQRHIAVPNRLSLASIATDSTKLGEIPERKWTSQSNRRRASGSGSDDLEQYNVAPVYPLNRYQPPPVKEKRFLGLFGRGP